MKYMGKLTKLRRILIEKGITQRELENRTEIEFKIPVKQDRISAISIGRQKNITLITLCKLAHCLGVEPADLIEEDILNNEFKEN